MASPTTGPTPSNNTNSASTNCTQCTITSETTATVPTDRARRTVGVGEEVTLTVAPGPATWTATAGSVSPSSGTTVTFRAPDRAGSATVTAAGSGCTCQITFTVIEPSGLRMVRESNVRHAQGHPDCGFLARPNVQPDTVSFHNIEIRELNSQFTGQGYYQPFNGASHQPSTQTASAWFTVGQCSAGSGSPASCLDQVYSGYTNGAVCEGLMTAPITWEFRVGTGSSKAMPAFEQRHAVTGAGDCTTSKGGASETTHLNDPTSGY
jgi:hypothetical protein